MNRDDETPARRMHALSAEHQHTGGLEPPAGPARRLLADPKGAPMTSLPAWRRILGRALPARRVPCQGCGWRGPWVARFDNRPVPSGVAHQCPGSPANARRDIAREALADRAREDHRP